MKTIPAPDIINKLPETIYWMDKEGKIIGCNDLQAQLFGMNSAKDLEGKNIFDVAKILGWPEAMPKKIRQNDINIMKSGQKEIIEEEIILNGKQHIFLSFKEPWIDQKSNEIIGIIGIAIDITDRKKLEEQLKISNEQLKEAQKLLVKANKAKLDLLYILDRELRSLINSITSSASLLQHEELTDEQTEYINMVVQSSDSIPPLLDTIKDYISLETGDFALLNQDMLLRATFEDRIKNIINTARNYHIDDIILDYPAKVPNEIVADSIRISQIMNVLLNNAIRFSHQGMIIVKVEKLKLKDHKNNQATLKISVTDEGQGLSKAKQEHLFELFTQSQTEAKESYINTGLRLSICAETVKLMGGQIGVDSKPDHGATFWFTIPAELSTRKLKPANDALWQRYYKKIHAMIVDDHAVRSKLIADILKPLKTTMSTGNAAFSEILERFLKKQPVNLLIVDNLLSSADTRELIRKILLHPKLKSIMIMVLVFNEQEKQMLKSQFNEEEAQQIGFLHKPILSGLPGDLASEWQRLTAYKPHVLVVEDVPMCQKVLVWMLKKYRCTVDVASSGQEALKLAKQHDYDLILMDVGLPDQSGVDVTKQIKQMKKTHTPPIVAVTGYDPEIDIDSIAEAGINGYLQKPVDLKAIGDLLQSLAVFEGNESDEED